MKMCFTCDFTVSGAMARSLAISLLDRPSAINLSMSLSCDLCVTGGERSGDGGRGRVIFRKVFQSVAGYHAVIHAYPIEEQARARQNRGGNQTCPPTRVALVLGEFQLGVRPLHNHPVYSN